MAPTSRAAVRGTHRVPGDKSVTHRAILLGALAPGRSTIGGALTSLDAKSSARVVRALGASVSPLRPEAILAIIGPRRWQAPTRPLDCGNSGTTARLLLGLLAGHRFPATLTGDASLRRRPMRRVSAPLVAMGARVDLPTHDGLPLTLRGGRLQAIEWTLPVASAQLKSAILLAGVTGGVPVVLHEPAASRDHTERMLRHFGYTVEVTGSILRFAPTGRLVPFELQVPGDPSSAAFLLAAAALAPAGAIEVAGVGCNPSRIGFLEVMSAMGARVGLEGLEESFGEPVGTLGAAASALRAVDVPAEVAPAIIDEVPILAAMAARAEGVSRFRGLAELRVKESDRLALMATNLRALGVEAEVQGDDLLVVGTDRPLAGRVVTHGDHRIAMAFQVLGFLPKQRITVDDPACADVSFPGFLAALAGLRAR